MRDLYTFPVVARRRSRGQLSPLCVVRPFVSSEKKNPTRCRSQSSTRFRAAVVRERVRESRRETSPRSVRRS
eukprot:30927-Pelagococcus_subviridis.AAC.3